MSHSDSSSPGVAGPAFAFPGGQGPSRPPSDAASGALPALPVASSLSRAEWTAVVTACREAPYRAQQAFAAYWARGAGAFEALRPLPRPLIACLAERLRFSALAQVEDQVAADGTRKWLLGLSDARRIETVMIPEGARRTVCVSTQVGCPIACIFCASGVDGLTRNLHTGEIAEQVLHVRRALEQRPTHIVVMGMGEPLLNLDSLDAAIRLWTDPEGLAFSPRRITVSTAGTPAMVARLAERGLGVNLAVSLHGPNDEVRARLIPGSPSGRVRGLVEAATRYATATGRDATAEYVLVAGVNDAPEHAEELARLLMGGHIHVNLIPLNPVRHRPDLRPPPPPRSRAFQVALRQGGVSATLRSQRGEDIAAACGQLALDRTLART